MADKKKMSKLEFFLRELKEWINENPDGDVGYQLTRVRGNVFSLRAVYPADVAVQAAPEEMDALPEFSDDDDDDLPLDDED